MVKSKAVVMYYIRKNKKWHLKDALYLKYSLIFSICSYTLDYLLNFRRYKNPKSFDFPGKKNYKNAETGLTEATADMPNFKNNFLKNC